MDPPEVQRAQRAQHQAQSQSMSKLQQQLREGRCAQLADA